MKQDDRWETPGLALFDLVLMEFGTSRGTVEAHGIKVRGEHLKQIAPGNSERWTS